MVEVEEDKVGEEVRLELVELLLLLGEAAFLFLLLLVFSKQCVDVLVVVVLLVQILPVSVVVVVVVRVVGGVAGGGVLVYWLYGLLLVPVLKVRVCAVHGSDAISLLSTEFLLFLVLVVKH